MALYEKHQETLEKGIQANRERTFYAHYPEHPKAYGKENSEQGQQNFEAMKGKAFEELLQENPKGWVGEEVSPYTQEKLGITYPQFDPDTLVKRAHEAYRSWREVDYRERAGVLMEALEAIQNRWGTSMCKKSGNPSQKVSVWQSGFRLSRFGIQLPAYLAAWLPGTR